MDHNFQTNQLPESKKNAAGALLKSLSTFVYSVYLPVNPTFFLHMWHLFFFFFWSFSKDSSCCDEEDSPSPFSEEEGLAGEVSDSGSSLDIYI